MSLNEVDSWAGRKVENRNEESSINYTSKTSFGDNQVFPVNLIESAMLPSYSVEVIENTKFAAIIVGYKTTSRVTRSNAIGSGSPVANNKVTFQTNNGTKVKEMHNQAKDRIVNRTAIKKETITTKAGTFNCWVVEGHSEKNKKMTVVDYFSAEVGIVKREYKIRDKTFERINLVKAE